MLTGAFLLHVILCTVSMLAHPEVKKTLCAIVRASPVPRSGRCMLRDISALQRAKLTRFTVKAHAKRLIRSLQHLHSKVIQCRNTVLDTSELYNTESDYWFIYSRTNKDDYSHILCEQTVLLCTCLFA